MTTDNTKLNLACGNHPLDGWDNVDYFNPDPSVIRIDLFDVPWDLPSNHYSQILIKHFLEHIPHRLNGHIGEGFFRFMNEVFRIAENGALLHIVVPHPSRTVIDYAGHTRVISQRTFRTWICLLLSLITRSLISCPHCWQSALVPKRQ